MDATFSIPYSITRVEPPLTFFFFFLTVERIDTIDRPIKRHAKFHFEAFTCKVEKSPRGIRSGKTNSTTVEFNVDITVSSPPLLLSFLALPPLSIEP